MNVIKNGEVGNMDYKDLKPYHKFDECKILRKKYPNCYQCGKKLVKGQKVIGISNVKGDPKVGDIMGVLCSKDCWKKCLEELGYE